MKTHDTNLERVLKSRWRNNWQPLNQRELMTGMLVDSEKMGENKNGDSMELQTAATWQRVPEMKIPASGFRLLYWSDLDYVPDISRRVISILEHQDEADQGERRCWVVFIASRLFKSGTAMPGLNTMIC